MVVVDAAIENGNGGGSVAGGLLPDLREVEMVEAPLLGI